MSKKIIVISLTIAVLGLAAESLAFVNFSRESFSTYVSIRMWLTTISLSYFNIRLLEYHNFDTGMVLNYLNGMMSLILLIGTIIYVVSKGRETRLIRFVMSVVLLSVVLFLLSQIVTPILYREHIRNMNYVWWINWVLGIARNLIVLYVAYDVLRTIKNTRVLETITEEVDGGAVERLQLASRWKRFANAMIDTFICLFIFSPFAGALVFLRDIERASGERVAVYVFMIIARLIYYCFFEITLQASPAKLLTETRVMTDEGEKPMPGAIIKRTFSRFIPFNGLSFFGDQGWHDTISYTRVVKIKPRDQKR